MGEETAAFLTSAAAVAEAFVPACADTLAFADPDMTIGLPSGPVP